MKPNLQSRLFWCLIVSTFTGALALTLPAAGAPAWLVQVLLAANTTAAAAGMYLRSQDSSQSRRSPPPAESAAVAGDPATPARRQSNKR